MVFHVFLQSLMNIFLQIYISRDRLKTLGLDLIFNKFLGKSHTLMR